MLASGDYRRQVTKAHHSLRRAYALVVSASAVVPPVAAAQWPAAEDVGPAVAHDMRVLLEEGRLRGDWEAQLEVSAAAGVLVCWCGGVLVCCSRQGVASATHPKPLTRRILYAYHRLPCQVESSAPEPHLRLLVTDVPHRPGTWQVTPKQQATP